MIHDFITGAEAEVSQSLTSAAIACGSDAKPSPALVPGMIGSDSRS